MVRSTQDGGRARHLSLVDLARQPQAIRAIECACTAQNATSRYRNFTDSKPRWSPSTLAHTRTCTHTVGQLSGAPSPFLITSTALATESASRLNSSSVDGESVSGP